jgi:hypothetical protein
MEKLLNDEPFFKLLLMVDAEWAQQAQAAGCARCGAKLHHGNYPRKPRGARVGDWRYSFCCSKCRKRKTPFSVRFLGRKVFAGVAVVLVSAMKHGVSRQRIKRLQQELPINESTLRRWRDWWLKTFVASPFWKGARARFSPALCAAQLPLSLVEAFRGNVSENMVRLLQFLAPITIGAFPGGGAM